MRHHHEGHEHNHDHGSEIEFNTCEVNEWVKIEEKTLCVMFEKIDALNEVHRQKKELNSNLASKNAQFKEELKKLREEREPSGENILSNENKPETMADGLQNEPTLQIGADISPTSKHLTEDTPFNKPKAYSEKILDIEKPIQKRKAKKGKKK